MSITHSIAEIIVVTFALSPLIFIMIEMVTEGFKDD